MEQTQIVVDSKKETLLFIEEENIEKLEKIVLASSPTAKELIKKGVKLSSEDIEKIECRKAKLKGAIKTAKYGNDVYSLIMPAGALTNITKSKEFAIADIIYWPGSERKCALHMPDESHPIFGHKIYITDYIWQDVKYHLEAKTMDEKTYEVKIDGKMVKRNPHHFEMVGTSHKNFILDSFTTYNSCLRSPHHGVEIPPLMISIPKKNLFLLNVISDYAKENGR